LYIYTLKIAVNTRFLLKDKLEGIGIVHLEYLKRITLSHPEHTFYFIFDRDFSEEFIFAKNIVPVVLFPPARHPFLWYWWFEWSVSKYLDKIKPDVFVSLDGYLSLKTKIPTLLLVHDISFVHFPNDIKGLVSKYYNYFTPKFVERADKIIAISDFVKKDIETHYKVPINKITRIYNGSNSGFYKIDNLETDVVKKQWTKGSDYFLYVGAIHPRKNIIRLIMGFEIFKKATKSNMKLVLAGRKAWKNDELEELIKESVYKNEIIFTGRIATDHLIELYNAAFATTYLPYFEGFGLPILESQLCGCPVITSNCTAMPEVGGNSVVYADPYNPDSIANAMVEMLNNREMYVQKCAENVKRFSWDESAKKLWEEIEKVSVLRFA
jgi:glycosyltransferase involved in cell wall biosynthesis